MQSVISPSRGRVGNIYVYRWCAAMAVSVWVSNRRTDRATSLIPQLVNMFGVTFWMVCESKLQISDISVRSQIVCYPLTPAHSIPTPSNSQPPYPSPSPPPPTPPYPHPPRLHSPQPPPPIPTAHPTPRPPPVTSLFA